MKKGFAVLISLLMLCLIGCSSEGDGVAVSPGSNLNLQTDNTVEMNIMKLGFENEQPFIKCLIKNKSDEQAIAYSAAFYIYDGEKEVKPNVNIVWDDSLYVLENGQENSQTFNLNNYELEDNKTYRLVKFYNIAGNDDTYGMYLDFKIDKSEIAGLKLKKKTDIWIHNDLPAFGDEISTYFLGDDNVLYSKTSREDTNVIKRWYKAYELEEFEPTTADFFGAVRGKWQLEDYSLNKLLEENETALRHIIDGNKNYIYILKQNNGDIYYVKGWSGVNGLHLIALLENNK